MRSSAPSADPAPDTEAAAQRQKATLLQRNAGIAYAVNGVNASLLAYVDAALGTPAGAAGSWWGLVVCAATARYAYVRRFRAGTADAAAVSAWRSRFVMLTALLGAIWGAGAVLFMWDASDGARLYTGLVLCGMVAGAIPILAPAPAAFRSFALLVGVPMAAVVFLQADSALHWAFGSMALVFLIAMLASAHFLHETLDTSIRLGLEKGQLLHNLARARRSAEAALEASNQSVWDYDVATGRVYLDENWAKIVGGVAGERVVALRELAEVLHPDDRERLARTAMDTLKGITTGYREDIRVRSADGDWRWVTCRGRVVERRADGRASRAVGTNVDITDRKTAEAALEASEQRYRTLFRDAPVGIALTTTEGVIVAANEALLRMFGVETEDLPHLHARSLYAKPADHDDLSRRMQHEQSLRGCEVELSRRDGSTFYGSLTVNRLDLEQGGLLLSIWEDISERKRAQMELQRSEARFRDIVDYSPIGMFIAAPDGQLAQANQALCAMLDYAHAELQRMKLPDITHPDDRTASTVMIQQLACGEIPRFQIEQRLLRKDGTPVWTQLTASVLNQPGHGLPHLLGQIEDITERQLWREQMQQQVNVDPLTELPNRRLLLDRLDQAIAEARRRRHAVAVLFLDLDRFKEINDSLGHDVGDQVLKEVAGRLKACVRLVDFVSRHGGDEFVVVLTDLAHPEDAAPVARKILDALSTPIPVDGKSLTVTPSIGISLYPGDAGEDREELVRQADEAMYAAKRDGRNRYRVHLARAKRTGA